MSNDKRDDGKFKDSTETLSGYNRYDVTSLLVKLARRGPRSEEDREKIQRYRDELVEDGVLEVIKESDGPGRPTKKYRLSETLPN